MREVPIPYDHWCAHDRARVRVCMNIGGGLSGTKQRHRSGVLAKILENGEDSDGGGGTCSAYLVCRAEALVYPIEISRNIEGRLLLGSSGIVRGHHGIPSSRCSYCLCKK